MRARLQVDAAARIKGRPHARLVIVEMPLSRFIFRRRSIRSSPRCTRARTSAWLRMHARTHVRTSRATVRLAVLCICLCVYGSESLMRQVPTVRTCIGNGTSRVSIPEEASGSRSAFDAFSRFSHVASYEISFASCSLTRADVSVRLVRRALLCIERDGKPTCVTNRLHSQRHSSVYRREFTSEVNVRDHL